MPFALKRQNDRQNDKKFLLRKQIMNFVFHPKIRAAIHQSEKIDVLTNDSYVSSGQDEQIDAIDTESEVAVVRDKYNEIMNLDLIYIFL